MTESFSIEFDFLFAFTRVCVHVRFQFHPMWKLESPNVEKGEICLNSNLDFDDASYSHIYNAMCVTRSLVVNYYSNMCESLSSRKLVMACCVIVILIRICISSMLHVKFRW